MLLPATAIEEAITKILRPSSNLGLLHEGTVVSPVKIVQVMSYICMLHACVHIIHAYMM
jgi:hypothetical protein